MAEANEVVTVRRLPDGDVCPARMTKGDGDCLSLLAADGEWDQFGSGALVEIETKETLYLGEVASHEPGFPLIVAVQHFIDRAALAELEKNWKETVA